MLTKLESVPGQAGFSMIEVLVTMLIVAFGLLGLAGLQMRIQTAEMESYQRAQALVLLNDMADRIMANAANASLYVTTSGSHIGTGATFDCTTITSNATALRDCTEWGNGLLGSGETVGAAKVGAMVGARGCIAQKQARDVPTCQAGIYEISVAWQGLGPTAAPAASMTCGQNLYGAETYRRVVSTRVAVGVPECG